MISPGVRLGRYEVLSPLGAGGMGEVYRARDTKLDRRVALKVLPDDVAADPDRLKRFEREAKATAALSHPNVLTVFDVGHEDGRAYLVFELLEGSTLGTRLARGPLSPDEALGYAAQIARGLAAAHARGIVHRDLKPDNLFLTTAGVVKVLDFGLARVQPAGERDTTASDVSTPGTVMGTVSYMAPEQAKGHAGDGRSDIFALGTVLYEMLSGKHPFKRDSSAETLTAILRDEPQDLEMIAGAVPAAARLVRRCQEKRPEDRFQTAHDLALALEAVSQAESAPGIRGSAEAADAGDGPYPGLSSYTQADAGRFFGREAEVAALWEKVRRQSFLALIGPSGVGKTSFLRAGLIANAPPGWAAAFSTPGPNPSLGLAQGLTHDLAGDPSTLTGLMQGVGRLMQSGETEGVVAAVKRWRGRTREALLVVDQFEELFTLNPKETQDRFAQVLGGLTSEANVHVLLSMRDDFLFRCTELPPLFAVFDSLMPLTQPSPEALRRALVEPAARLGVRFEDEALVAEMVAAVEKERGALPLLAFAVSRLWEERDREKKLLTRAAYARIGGVAGALAQHAEATLREVGPGQEAVVREIFRNLVTAEGTRAARERGELLSVFAATLGEPGHAATVLDQLVDSRLLTEYQEANPPPSPVAAGADEVAPGPACDSQRIEIVHESLLTHWPRLERWLAQDAEGALLRDQLRQAARLWDDKGRTDELLWTGRAYREYAVWRERYAGHLSTLEEDFAAAMTRLARRRRTRRRMAVGALVAGALAVAVVTLGLWRQSEVARRAAEAEARRREAAEILALGRGKLADDPTTALAYALASLEKADGPEARRFAVEALWHGPTALLMTPSRSYLYQARFSAKGDWLATFGAGPLFAWPRRGGPPLDLNPSSAPDAPQVKGFGFAEDESSITTVDDRGQVRVWSLPEGRVLRTAHLEGLSDEERPRTNYPVVGERIIGHTSDPPDPSSPNGSHVFRSWASAGGPPKLLGRIGGPDFYDLAQSDAPRLWILRGDGRITFQRVDKPGPEPVTVGRHPKADWLRMSRDGRGLSSATEDGDVRLWRIVDERLEPWRTLRGPGDVRGIAIDPLGRFLAGGPLRRQDPTPFVLWDLRSWPDAAPVPLKKWEAGVGLPGDFSPDGAWMVTAHEESAALWRLGDRLPRRLQLRRGTHSGFAFSPDSRRLAVGGMSGTLEIFPVQADAPAHVVLRDHGERTYWGASWDPAGHFLLTSEGRLVSGKVTPMLVPVDGGRERVPPEPEGGRTADQAWSMLLAPDGRRVVIGANVQGSSELRVWDLKSNKVRVLPPLGPDCSFYSGATMLGPDQFVTNIDELRLWDLASGESTRLKPCEKGWSGDVRATPDGRQIVLLETYGPSSYGNSQERQTTKRTRLYVFDVASHRERFITTHGERLDGMALDPTGIIVVTGDQLGVVRVGPVSGEEPHLLYGHTGNVGAVAVSPDGKWIASRAEDGIRLWPMPKGRPLHTLPYEELLAKLRSLTNLRIVPDPAAATGFRTVVGPFPGWAGPPEW